MTIADHPFAFPKTAGYRGARRRRAQIVLLTFGLFAAAFAAILALRAAVWLPGLHHSSLVPSAFEKIQQTEDHL